MYSETEVEYLEAIRQAVCVRCSNRPAGGLPCALFGRRCAVELDLPLILQAIHEADRTGSMALLVEKIRRRLANQGQGCCFCPRDYVLMQVVQAVRSFDDSRWSEEEKQPSC